MTGALTWEAKRSGDVTTVALHGDITERSDFGALLSELPGGAETVLDLADIRRIDSSGVREWLTFVRGAERAGKPLVLDRCSVAFVHQLNMIAKFAGHGRVRSAMAPFYCSPCNVEAARVIDLSRGVPEQVSPPERCEKCGGMMEFDDLLEYYERLRVA
jgi:ABC-type transporter Mla MlaB component